MSRFEAAGDVDVVEWMDGRMEVVEFGWREGERRGADDGWRGTVGSGFESEGEGDLEKGDLERKGKAGARVCAWIAFID